MQKAYLTEVKTKIVTGVFALTTRTFILQIISFASTFILTILLSPEVFGVFFVVQAVISFLSYFSDIGLAAALIQKKEEPTPEELKTVFTIQQVLVGSLLTLAFLFASNLTRIYKLGSEGLFLFQALLVSFFLSSLKTIPSVLLERKLEFKLLVIPQILETTFFYLTAIILALTGGGIRSFAWAAIVRGLVGLVSIYLISPWRITLGISKEVTLRLLSFGLPFQANSILALIKDDLMTIFLGKILPFSYVGYIGWAKKWAEAPLRLIMDNIIKVTFPVYARLQEDKLILGKAIGKSFFFLSLLIFPITFLLVLSIKPLIYLIPRYTKWEPAVFSFYLFAFSAVMASFSSPAVNALNALGKIRATLILMIVWTILTWILVPTFSFYFGYNGVAMAFFLISFTSFLPILLLKRFVSFRMISSASKPLVFTALIFLPIYVLLFVTKSLLLAIVLPFLGLLVYLLVIKWFIWKEILPYLPKFLK